MVLAYLVISIRRYIEWRAVVKGEDPGAKYKYMLTKRSVKYIYEQMIFPQLIMLGAVVHFNNLLYMMSSVSEP